MHPKISNKIALLVPCYNASEYIIFFLSHIAKLNFGEIIFYNDGSTDNTLEILQKSGYRYITGDTNNGPGFARNRLAEASSCDYIHFHDIDDQFSSDFINIIQKALIANQPDVLLGNADWIDKQSGNLIIKWCYNKNDINKNALTYFVKNPLGVINTVYKRDTFLKVGGFNEEYNCWEDADLHIRLAHSQANFIYINKTLAYSLRHNQGISTDQEWCWECRYKYLIKYIFQFHEEHHSVILDEIAKCANIFYRYKKYDKLMECYMLCKRYNINLPISNNRIIGMLKWLNLPLRFIYDVQSIARNYY